MVCSEDLQAVQMICFWIKPYISLLKTTRGLLARVKEEGDERDTLAGWAVNTGIWAEAQKNKNVVQEFRGQIYNIEQQNSHFKVYKKLNISNRFSC